MKRAPWGHVSRHCFYCRQVGPRVQVLGGWAHRRCIPKEPKRPVVLTLTPKQAEFLRLVMQDYLDVTKDSGVYRNAKAIFRKIDAATLARADRGGT